MKKQASAALLCAALAACEPPSSEKNAAAEGAAAAPAVDTALINGTVHTMNPEQPTAQALAVRRGVITAVGDTAAVQALAGPDTEIIDLQGQAVLPGFHDLHVHPLFAGMSIKQECSIPQGSTLEQVQRAVGDCAARTADGRWVVGGQWDVSALGQTPHRRMLDAVAPDIPVLLRDTSGHSAWVNSRALAAAAVTRDTPNPEGGIIERDANGELTGVLRELAVDMIRAHIPPLEEETMRTALKWAADEMLANGVTSYTVAAVGFMAGAAREVNLYSAMMDEGLLRQRIRLCVT